MTAAADLAARMTSEESIARYEVMQQQLRDRLDAELGPFEWYVAREQDEAGCGTAFPADLGGRRVGLASWTFDGNLANWDRATAIATEVVAGYGFAVVGSQVSQGDVRTYDAVDAVLGAEFSFRTNVNTLFHTTTGCHLPSVR